MSLRTIVAIPTYNELENVESLCLEILAQGLDLDLVFLDDASPDGTGEVLDRLAKVHARVFVVHRPGKLGIGSAHLDAIRRAYDENYDLLITMDGDFTHQPSYLANFLSLAGSAQVVVGSRYLQPDSLEEWSWQRRFMTYCGHALTRTLLGLTPDASSAFRLYRLKEIPRQAFELVRARGYGFFFESLYMLVQNGFVVREVPIHLPGRANGHSKLGVREAVAGLARLAALWLEVTVRNDRLRLPPRR